MLANIDRDRPTISRKLNTLKDSEDCGKEAQAQCSAYGLTSNPSNVQRQLTIFNNVADRSTTLYWINFDGQKVKYATIPPFGRYKQPTCLGHVWVLENTFGYCDSVFVVENNVLIEVK